MRAPLSIVIPTLDAEAELAATLASLGPGLEAGVIRDLVVSDGGSSDGTLKVAEEAGAVCVTGAAGRGGQMRRGAEECEGDWLLFLHADTRLSQGWTAIAAAFMRSPANRRRAGYFRFRLDSDDPRARRLENSVAWRNRRLGLPYGDQGLLIGRGFYHATGGFPRIPLFEDVALVRKIGGHRLVALDADAVTSAARYARNGFRLRATRNVVLLSLYFLGVPARWLARLY